MSRTPSFDSDVVVRAARALFWQSGYEGASIPALEEATGLSRSSIYNAFGSKRGLFDAAVRSYLDEVIRPRLLPLTTEPVEKAAVLEYLDGLRDAFERAESMAGVNGCLLINTAAAPLAHDAEVARIIVNYREELHAAIGRGVAAYLEHIAADERDRLTDAVTGLAVAAYALVRVVPSEAVGLLTTARELLTSAAASSGGALVNSA